MPNNLAGSIVGISSLGRHGLIIETAPVVHPGFSGCLTLELANVGEIPIALRPGMEIAQLQLEYASGTGKGTGRFSGYRRPVLGPIRRDPMLDILADWTEKPAQSQTAVNESKNTTRRRRAD